MTAGERVHELFLNYACGAKCPFCYNPPITPELLRRELSFEEAARSLYEGARGGARKVNLHGGEVTLRDDLPKVLRLARKLGYAEATVVTNGLRLSEEPYARLLASSGATHFRLSIHAPDAPAHDALLGVPGAFEKALRALGNLRRLRAGVGLNFVLNRVNLAGLPDFLERFCLKEGVDDVIVYFPHLRGMMELNAASMGLTYEEASGPVRDGAARLRRADRLGSLSLANFPPCALPELLGRMLDWERGRDQPSTMTHPEGFTGDLGLMKDEQRGPIPACASCAVGGRCLGVERAYLARSGAGGLRPLAREAAEAAA